jgi:UDP-glucose 4-epimerase
MIHQLRTGRGLDNRRFKASGYTYRYTTREALLKFHAHQRLRPLLGRGGESYRYEREVEEFLRWSPSVHAARSERRDGADADHGDGDGADHGDGDGADHSDGDPPVRSYEDLSEGELIDLISSLEPDALRRLRTYEARHAARARVLDALDRNLARQEARS